MMKSILKNMLPAALMLMGAFAASAAEDSFEFTYANGASTSRVGFQQQGDYGGCIYIDNADFQGMKLTGITVPSLNTVNGDIDNYKLWWSTSLPTDTTFSENAMDVTPDGDGNILWNLPQGVEIGAEGIYVGFSFTVVPEITGESESWLRFPFPYAKTSVSDNAMLLSYGGGWWTDYTSQFGALTIKAIISGELKDNAVSLTKVVSCPVAQKGKTTRASFQVVNGGSTAVKNVEITYTMNGKETTLTKNVTLSKVGAKTNMQVVLPALDTPGVYPVDMKITKVNGMDNASVKPSLSFQVCLPAFNAHKRVLMEEGTGSWCGWCTRGWLAMKLMNAKYPDEFIGAAYHADDAMDVTAQDPMDFGGGYPGCAIDRTYNALDPYYGSTDDTELGIEGDFQTAQKNNGYGDIGIETSWNADSTELTVNPTLILGAVTADQMKIGYILIQNHLVKEDSRAFAQSNYYNGRGGNYAEDSPLQEICKMESAILNFSFDDCVINSDYCTGIDGTLPSPADIKLQTEYKHSQKFQTVGIYGIGQPQEADYNLITNKKEIEVVVLLIGDNGKVLNARKVVAGENAENEVGIMNVVDDNANAPVVYYDLQGRQILNPAHGLFIKKQGSKASKVIL